MSRPAAPALPALHYYVILNISDQPMPGEMYLGDVAMEKHLKDALSDKLQLGIHVEVTKFRRTAKQP